MSGRRTAALLAVLLAVLFAGAGLLRSEPAQPPEDAPPENAPPEERQAGLSQPEKGDAPDAGAKDDGLPHDKLFITPERQAYQDGDLRLIIPRLELDREVLNGTSAEVLKRGVGLYDYAQLPGEGNRNVSVAGHRNGRKNGIVNDHAPFYYIDTLEEGDFLYLRDDEKIYQYCYEDTSIVEADDWGPIYSQGFSCLTLTSCHPIGTTDRRIIVRARLTGIIDAGGEEYTYPMHKENPQNETDENTPAVPAAGRLPAAGLRTAD